MGVSENRGTIFGVLIMRILLFRVLYWGPLFSESPTWFTNSPWHYNLRFVVRVTGFRFKGPSIQDKTLNPKP